MSSKADDFDVRYRDAGPAEHGRPAADGGYRGNAGDVDYDLGYDSPGWDAQGFRRPEADFTTATNLAGPATWSAAVSAPRCAPIPAMRPGAAGTAATRARRARQLALRNPPS